MRTRVIVVGLVMAACGGNGATKPPGTASVAPSATEGAAAGTPASGVTDTRAIALAPFKLIPTAKPDRAVDVKADGTALVGGKLAMRFVDSELRTPEGHTILSLAQDGTVTLHRNDNTEEVVGKLNEKDEFSPKRQGGRGMWLDENGGLKLLGAPDFGPGKEPLKLEGVDATNRRAAMLMTILFFTATTAAKTEVTVQASAASTERPSRGDAGAPPPTPAAPKTKK